MSKKLFNNVSANSTNNANDAIFLLISSYFAYNISVDFTILTWMKMWEFSYACPYHLQKHLMDKWFYATITNINIFYKVMLPSQRHK